MNKKEYFFYLEDLKTHQVKQAIGATHVWQGDRDHDIPNAIQWLKGNLTQPFCPVFLPFENGTESLKMWIPEAISCEPISPSEMPTENKLTSLHEINFESAYLETVEKALVELKSQTYEKIVLTRGYSYQKPKELTIEKILGLFKQSSKGVALIGWQEKSLDDQSLTPQTQEYGFAAMTPEVLFSFENGILKSEAVAGTIRRGSSPIEDEELAQELLNCPKTRHEHDCVVQMITQSLLQLGFRVDIGEKNIRKLTLMQHIVTPITAHGNAHALEIAALLHPTPAVCGYPKDVALHNIQSLEAQPRKGYAGAFGWVNPKGEGAFFVGLRGVQWQNDILEVRAGCGIVADSNPTQELEEANLKLNSILSIFAKNSL